MSHLHLVGTHALRWQSGCREPLETFLQGAQHLFRVTTVKWTAGQPLVPLSCWEAGCGRSLVSMTLCSMPLPSFSCPPRLVFSLPLALAYEPFLSSVFCQLLTSRPCWSPRSSSSCIQSSLAPNPVPLSLSLSLAPPCWLPLTYLTPGPSASLLPPCPTPLPSSFRTGVWMHL